MFIVFHRYSICINCFWYIIFSYEYILYVFHLPILYFYSFVYDLGLDAIHIIIYNNIMINMIMFSRYNYRNFPFESTIEISISWSAALYNMFFSCRIYLHIPIMKTIYSLVTVFSRNGQDVFEKFSRIPIRLAFTFQYRYIQRYI